MMKQVPAPLIGLTTVDPVDDLLNCQQAIRSAGWWERGLMSEHWPLTSDEVSQMLTLAGEFQADAEDLSDLIERRILPRPSVGESGEMEWSAVDVIAAGGLLEMRGQWKAHPSGHDAKKHVTQILLEQARQEGAVTEITRGPGETGPRFDVPHLFAMLAAADNREARVKTLSLLKAVLEVDHGVIVP